jgi:hypothetical protein
MKNWIVKGCICLIIALFSGELSAATCTAIVNNGNWTNGASWSCGHQPANNDVVIIPDTITILISTNMSGNTDILQLHIYGILEFNSGKIGMGAGSGVSIYTGGKIINTGGGGNSSNIVIGGTTVWKASDGTVTGPTSFGIPVPLPVELIYFTGNNSEGQVTLSWQTAQETNNDHFEIQRSSDGVNYTVIGEIKGSGSLNYPVEYSYTDENPLPGIVYYRLLQVDTDKRYSISNAIAINVSGNDMNLSIAPNPVTDGSFEITANVGKASEVTISISNSQGSELFTQSISGSTIISVTNNSLNLVSGIYIVSIKNGHTIIHNKIIVQ